MNVQIHSHIDDIPADQWNQLVKDNHPFIRHEFLLAMEQHQCVGEKFGWISRHIAIYDDDQLIAAMPLYEKYNSYGEFVFDHAWANAYQRHGLEYFPKLVSSIPYTPATGQRFLCESGQEATLFPMLLTTAIQLANKIGASSFHCLFPTADAHDFMQQRNLMSRYDCQFHWHNQDYQDFDHFLSQLNSRKRKRIKQERRKAQASGVTLRVLDGHQATTKDWQDFTQFYNQTFIEKSGMPTFNQAFFMQIAHELPDQVILVLADQQDQCIAGALMYRSDTHLYGRHWGCIEHLDQLHFEVCYYQGIEYCIREKLICFEPGAQGEHKMARGFLPTRTASSHWIASEQFAQPIHDFVQHEQQAVLDYIEQMNESSPYRKTMP